MRLLICYDVYTRTGLLFCGHAYCTLRRLTQRELEDWRVSLFQDLMRAGKFLSVPEATPNSIIFRSVLKLEE